jgi:hypothetical protein
MEKYEKYLKKINGEERINMNKRLTGVRIYYLKLYDKIDRF